jgi:serine protease inhibitor
MNKRIVSLLLIAVMGLSLCACGNKEVVDVPTTPPVVEIEKPDIPVETPSKPEIENPSESEVDVPIVEPEISDVSEIDFGEGSYDLRLFSTLLLNDENIQNNLCVSPFSLKQALLMVLQGAE